MTFLTEALSWNPITWVSGIQSVPNVGDQVPAVSALKLPRADKKPTVMALLRHCGCPFAEKTMVTLRAAAEKNPQVHFIAVSHSDENATRKWLEAVGGSGSVEIVVDYERHIYAAYGLGLSSFWHVLNGGSLGGVSNLEKTEKIGIRPTESGSRWQKAGMFAVNGAGVVKYSHPAQSAEDMGNVNEALASLK